MVNESVLTKELTNELTTNELVEKINDYYHNGTVLIFSDFGNCKINIANTDNLMAEESNDNIIMYDDADLEIIIPKQSINKSILVDFELDDEKIIMDLGNSHISFILCNNN